MATAGEQRRIPLSQVAGLVEKSVGELDSARAAGLGELAQANQARLNVLERDRKRLEDKLGAEHPRVVALKRALELGSAAVSELQVEQVTASIVPPTVDGKSWAFHGRVFDPKRRPVKGVTVALYQGDAWMQQFGHSFTDDNGYFLLRAAGPDSAVQSLSARVLRDSKVVHEDPRPVTIRLGQSEFREITLGEGPELGTAPVQDTRPKPPAPKG